MRMRTTPSSEQTSSHHHPSADTQQLDHSISADAARALKEEGNALFKTAHYQQAIEKYTQACKSAHASDQDRAVYLANRAAAHLKLQNFQQVVQDTSEALRLNPAYVKALSRRRQAREALKDWAGAVQDAKQLHESPADIRRLQMLAEEKDKRDREEAMQSLKGLGNSILSNFGMSLDDFSVDKDPQTGSYSINMKK